MPQSTSLLNDLGGDNEDAERTYSIHQEDMMTRAVTGETLVGSEMADA